MLERITSLIAQALGIETTDINESSILREDLGLEEGDLSELLVSINQKYNTAIPEERLGDIKTVADFVELVETYVETKV